MWIDSHCHLSFPGLAESVPAALAAAAAAGVGRCITIGTQLDDYSKTIQIATLNPSVFYALGVHPHHAAETDPGYEAFLERSLTASPKAVALGECGLDYHYDHFPRLLQRGIFLNQLEIARRRKLPVILHIREAHPDGLAIMKDFPELQFVIHCFTGTPAECRAWLDLGAYIGITGIVTYKNADDVREDAKMVPADRLLIETDAPYLSPEPVRHIKTNTPAHVAYVGRYLATLRGVAEEELGQQTTSNTARLFGDKILA